MATDGPAAALGRVFGITSNSSNPAKKPARGREPVLRKSRKNRLTSGWIPSTQRRIHKSKQKLTWIIAVVRAGSSGASCRGE